MNRSYQQPIRRKSSRSSGSSSSFSSLLQTTLNPSHHLRRRTVKKAAIAVDKYATDLLQKSHFLSTCCVDNDGSSPVNHDVPLLDRSEIQLGQLLGGGGFCKVYEIVGIAPAGRGGGDPNRRALTKEASSLVMKQLRQRWAKNPAQFTLAAADLVLEAHYLRSLVHPHIVPIRGLTRGGLDSMKTAGGFDSYFLVLDRMESTLHQRIRAWQRGGETEPSYHCKLTYAWHLAQALQYLHERRIVFRDCKPDNIGFRMDNGLLQLFDFGLVRELPVPQKRPEEEDPHEEFYLMTKIGTRRYCAVEMFVTGRYNEKIDVYSWAMTVYEMISLCRPFAHMTDADHQELVCLRGKRPDPKPFLQQCEQTSCGQRNPLLALVRQAWEQHVSHRVDMANVLKQMKNIIQELEHQQQCAGSSDNFHEEIQAKGSMVCSDTATDAESDIKAHGHRPGCWTSDSPLGSVSPTPSSEDDVKDVGDGNVQKDEDIDRYNEQNGGGGSSTWPLPFGSLSLETKGSEQSLILGGDSIGSSQTGWWTDVSLSSIVFDLVLSTRRSITTNAVIHGPPTA